MNDRPLQDAHEDARPSSAEVRSLIDGFRDAFRLRAEAEARIEETIGTDLRSTEDLLGSSLREADDTHAETVRGHEETYGRIETDVRTEVDRHRDEAIVQHAAERERIAEVMEPEEDRLGAQLREAVWLAETMYEANEEKPADEFGRTRAVLDAALRRLRSLESELAALIAALRQRAVARRVGVPDPEEAAASVDSIEDACQQASEGLGALARARLPRLFESANPFIVFVLLGAIAPTIVAWRAGWQVGQDTWVAAGAGAVGAGIILLLAHRLVRRSVTLRYTALARIMQGGYASHERELADAVRERDDHARRLVQRRDSEIVSAKVKFGPRLEEIRKRRQQAEEKAAAAHASRIGELERRASETIARARADRDAGTDRATELHAEARSRIDSHHRGRRGGLRDALERETGEMVTEWRARIARGYARLTRLDGACASLFPAWDPEAWQRWRPPSTPPHGVRIGSLAVDLAALPGGLPRDLDLAPDGPLAFELPALLDVPDRCSMLIEADPAGRQAAVDILRAVMLRLLTTFPAGQARFTIFDPVGLGQNFAGFMHLADYEEALVSDRIWTEQRHIERRLTDLTEHMENVIQKYLRNEFSTITAYNERAGEIAEPYRFLVIADFPANFNEASVRRLISILQSGPRCGVFTLIMRDVSQRLPSGVSRDDLKTAGVVVSCRKGEIAVDEETSLDGLSFAPEPPPPEALVTAITRRVGQAAKDTSRVEVPFGVVAPSEGQIWSSECSRMLSVPIGRAGATKVQHLELGMGTLQHVLIAGKTGSGKSTLLHVLVTNLALWHHPDEVQFYLVDFKKGVEFKTYATHALPHARAVAIESEREFGLSVLQEVDAELRRRGAIYRDLGVQDIAGCRRNAPSEPMPRLLLIIDEFQELYTEDDKIAQESALLLDRLVRQGRAFGIHVILGSQTLGGAYTLARSTMGQMGVRIALQCSEADSYLILSEDNAAARLLSRPGEAIYNDASGLIEGNTPFQIVWLNDHERDGALSRVCDLAAERGYRPQVPQVIFEGNASANPARNGVLTSLLEGESAPESAGSIRVWLGSAVAIKEPTSAQFSRHTGSNLLIVGQRENEARGMIVASVIAAGAQTRDVPGARIVMIDGAGDASDAAFLAIAETLDGRFSLTRSDRLRDTLSGVLAELRRRRDAGDTGAPPLLLVVNGLHGLRELRRKDDDFSFSFGDGDGDGEAGPDRLFGEILDEGPSFGVHTITWCDSVLNLNRAVDRRTMRAFENRVLFQMSQTDSSDLTDSVQAARLGVHRALFYSEETGVGEKFHPYGPPDPGWLRKALDALRGDPVD